MARKANSGSFKKGVSGNPDGKPKGARKFETDFDEAVQELMEEEGVPRSTARKLMLKVAYKKSVDGEFNFFKYIHDQLYGTATNNLDIKSDGEKVTNGFVILPSKDVDTLETPTQTNEGTQE